MYSERLTYNLLISSDLKEVHNLLSMPEVDKFNTLGIPKNIEETEDFLITKIEEHQEKTKSKNTYSIRIKENSVFIGICGIHFSSLKYNKAELWMKFDPEFWGKGYATETITGLLEYCFDEHKLHRVEAGCASKNEASKRVLEKCGFVVEGLKRKNLPLKTGWSDNYDFGILREEWLNRNNELS